MMHKAFLHLQGTYKENVSINIINAGKEIVICFVAMDGEVHNKIALLGAKFQPISTPFRTPNFHSGIISLRSIVRHRASPLYDNYLSQWPCRVDNLFVIVFQQVITLEMKNDFVGKNQSS